MATENLQPTLQERLRDYIMNKYVLFFMGVLAGGILTAISTQKLGYPLQPFASTTVLLLSVVLIAVLAGSAMVSAHHLRSKGKETISGDTYFKIMGLGIIMVVLALAITTDLGRENLIATLGFLGTALGFVMGRTAAGKISGQASD